VFDAEVDAVAEVASFSDEDSDLEAIAPEIAEVDSAEVETSLEAAPSEFIADEVSEEVPPDSATLAGLDFTDDGVSEAEEASVEDPIVDFEELGVSAEIEVSAIAAARITCAVTSSAAAELSVTAEDPAGASGTTSRAHETRSLSFGACCSVAAGSRG